MIRGRKSTTNKNIRVREEARLKNVTLWRLAEAYGISEAKFSVMLRHELPKETQRELIDLVNRIAKEGA